MVDMTALERCRHFNVATIRGLAYMPAPSDYRPTGAPGLYETSDFYNNIFAELWGPVSPAGGRPGRADLRRFRERLGVNFIHCYDWAPPMGQRDASAEDRRLLEHVGFLQACHELGMTATIPISNYTLNLLSQGKTEAARRHVECIVEEIHGQNDARAPVPGAGMWKIFNEYELNFDRNAEHVVTVMGWIADWEKAHGVIDENRLPVVVSTSFALKDGIEGAWALKDVRDALLRRDQIGPYDPASFWRERILFATNPQNPGRDIRDYVAHRLPAYWQQHGIPIPPTMFTELGSSIEQAGGETRQAQWLAEQIEASKPGGGDGSMLGACVFLNEERPWEQGAERSFGLLRFGPDRNWARPSQNYRAETRYPVWDPRGWWWPKDAAYPVEQQAEKPAYRAVATAWVG
ncbi:MAG: hypothetical protein OJF58_003099 [Enhydrobacter sp.]|jgi:hypothetical protein|nr:MAG: hypothetical protein OJF58_003099 [Enhydrobacter sp.]